MHSLGVTLHLDPVPLAVGGLAAAAYLWAVLRLRRRGVGWPARRTVSFAVLGLGSLVGVSAGWPVAHERAMFSLYAVQVMAYLLVVPFLMVLGRPVELALAALPPRASERLATALSSRLARLVTAPFLGPLLLAALPFAIFFSALLPATLTHPAALSLLHAVLLIIGLGVLVPLWETETVNPGIPFAIALLFAFIELLADALPGIVIRLDTHVLAGSIFAAASRPWATSPLRDQQLGGDLLWGFGEVVDLPFLVLLFRQWLRSDAREAAAIDRALDADRTAARPPTGGVSAAGGPARTATTSDTGWQRPWWEDDASIFGDRAPEFEHDRPSDPPRGQ